MRENLTKNAEPISNIPYSGGLSTPFTGEENNNPELWSEINKTFGRLSIEENRLVYAAINAGKPNSDIVRALYAYRRKNS
ncbi:MAG: hypothetical protein KF900_14150 [Bacteroidetes bacterium]|nr:hypothetical protein [Bacteroidota bacterium]